MKTIRVLRSTGSHLPHFTEGQVAEVDDATAEVLCKLNLAEIVKAIPEEPLKAVPENASIQAAEDKLQEIKDRWTNGEGASESPKPKRSTKKKRAPKE